MSILLSIIAFIFIFSLLILIHEAGHFLMAKRADVKVEEFGFGIPPKIWGKKIGETFYSINWIPFGGFVKLYEESGEKTTNKRSFENKSIRQKIQIVVGGVTMNFLLAWLLLSIGFVIGMQPLITNEQDIYSNISNDNIKIASGVYLAKDFVMNDAERSVIKKNDQILTIDNREATEFFVKHLKADFDSNGIVVVEFLRDNVKYSKDLKVDEFELIAFANMLRLPFFKIISADNDGIQSSDIIWKINGRNVWDIKDIYSLLSSGSIKNLTIHRQIDDQLKEFTIDIKPSFKAKISEILPNSIAFKSGFLVGDSVVTINDHTFASGEEVVKFNSDNKGKEVKYLLENKFGLKKEIVLKVPDNGKIGLALSPVYDLATLNLQLEEVYLPYSILDIKNIKVPIYSALIEGFKEMYRLSKATVLMFGNVFEQFLSGGGVPASVTGPVGIAQMVHVSAQEGLISLLRLTALLSLSLAVVNILPIPALDGGRLLFILIEAIRGKKNNQKIEAIIHQIGFILLIVMILAITYKDIVRLIGL